MRILCPLNIFYVQHGIIQGLQLAGCEVLVLEDWPVQRSVLAMAVEDFHPDLIFTYAWWQGRLIPEDLAWLCREYRLPHIYWACDDPTHHHTISLPLARLADLVFTTTEELLPAYRSLGKKAAYLQHGCNPKLHRRVDPPYEMGHDIVVVAHNDSHLDSMQTSFRLKGMRIILEPLVQAGFDLKAYGDGWDDTSRPIHLPPMMAGGPVPYPSLSAVYSTAAIVLGLQAECHWTTQTSCRPFEVLGCRAFHLTPATRSMTNLFVPGKHLMVSRSAAETLAITQYYLDHDEERERIAAAGQLEVYRKHTCLHRAREFLAEVEHF